jgi:hypothetical protein
MVVVYSTEWTGDIVLGNTIINILKELLDRRGIRYQTGGILKPVS